MELSAHEISSLLARSRLLTPEEAEAAFERWHKEVQDEPEDLGQFTKWLAANRYVTDYQATLLSRGHSEGFFLQQYKILDRIGRGRMAGVYKAIHHLGQVVAIKVLPPSRAKDPVILARFQREARLAVRLQHPNVVRGYQMGEAGGHNYLVMEYLEGETLEEILQRRTKLPPAEAVRLVHQAFLGLQHIHEQGLVHRDLKPSNMMLVPAVTPGQSDTTANATLKILDIGLGRVLFDENAPVRSEDPQLTAAGVVLGTPDYMAPEQARDARSADIRADIYSLGCVLFHALTGQPPFPDSNFISQMIRHGAEKPRALKTFDPTLPKGLQPILDTLLAKDPAQRYATPIRAAEALQAFLAGTDKMPPSPEDPRLHAYVKWLETESGDLIQAPPVTTPTSSVETTALPVPPEPERPAAKTVTTAAAKMGSGRLTRPEVHSLTQARPAKPTSKPPLATTARAVESKPAVAAESFDVELVPAGAIPQATQDQQRWFDLSRRDFVMLGAGAMGVLSALVLGRILAHLLGNEDPKK
jgi:serine/threonine protein kinase